MTTKKTSFKYMQKPLPEYEVLTQDEITRTTSSNPCCSCTSSNSSACSAEDPNGIGQISADWLGNLGALSGAK